MTVFIGVYKAIYSYEPQTPEELAIQEDDMLYLLQKSDIDEWWTVKKRIIGSDDPEPSGLVPSTYIEEAPVMFTVKAVYDYDQPQNPDEELSFHENDTFQVYDDKDPDWLLVKSQNNEFGFVPGNYVESDSGAGAAPVAAPVAAAVATIPTAAPVVTPANANVSNFLPPPQHNQRDQYEEQEQNNNEPATPGRYSQDNEREDTPPSKPARPNDARDKARSRVSYYADDNDNDNYHDDRSQRDNGRRDDNRGRYDDYDNDRSRNANNNNEDNGGNQDIEYHSWNVQEIDGRKKRKAKLVVGSNKINFISESGTQLEWTVDKLVSYDNEKKHMFLEFVDPYKNLELHTGNNETSNEIMDILGEIKGASRDKGLKEIESASQTKRKAKILYDFIGESNDELTVKEGDLVYIINDKKSKEWWMCESVDTGRRGVIPSQFVEPLKEKSSSGASGLFNSLKKMAKGKSPSKSHSHSNSVSGSWRDDVTPDETASSKSRSRGASFSSRKKRSASMSKPSSDSANKKKFPDPKKSRLWVDRSGTFKVDAQFIGCANGKIHLHKANGVKIAVAANKLSDSDLMYVENITGFSLDKFKVNSSGGSSSGNKDARESERDRRRRLREQDEKERDRRLRERELNELKKARQLLDDERLRLEEQKDLPPVKPPRPNSTVGMPSSSSSSKTKSKNNYDWFEFFLNSGVDVSNCQRYTINFDREQITEDMMQDINAQMLRTLGLREGDIVRVMKFLDNKFGRDNQQPITTTQTGGMFTEADGSLKNNNNNNIQQNVSQQLLPQATAPAAAPVSQDDDAWTARPAAKSQPDLVSGSSNFTGSMQDLLDLQPLEPKKAEPTQVPEPNLNNLEPVKTGNAVATAAPIATATTGGANLVPLDPFKTGGNNILPIGTGFVMMPIATGGLMPMQRTGGLGMPATTFGGVLPVQKTSGGLIPIATTGGLMPQTTFGAQVTGGLMSMQTTGGLVPLQRTGGMMPQTTFGTAPPLGSVLPVQRTGNGLMPLQTTGGVMPNTTFINPALSGGAMPQTSFMNPALTGGMNTMINSALTGGMNPMVNPALTGGMNPMINPALTGGMNPMMNPALTGGAIPQTSFGNQMTGGAMPQTGFGNQMTGGAMMPQTSFGAPVVQQTNTMPMQVTGGFQPQSQFGMTLQRTGGVMSINNGVNNITQGLQNTAISQPQQLQTQPTGFGFGNGPQQTQQGRQANIFNASAANPFGF